MSYKMTTPPEDFWEEGNLKSDRGVIFLFYLRKKRGEEKKGRGKREKKAEKRVYKGFPRCGRGRKRNLGHYKEISIYSEVVKWAKVLFKKTWNPISPHSTR